MAPDLPQSDNTLMVCMIVAFFNHINTIHVTHHDSSIHDETGFLWNNSPISIPVIDHPFPSISLIKMAPSRASSRNMPGSHEIPKSYDWKPFGIRWVTIWWTNIYIYIGLIETIVIWWLIYGVTLYSFYWIRWTKIGLSASCCRSNANSYILLAEIKGVSLTATRGGCLKSAVEQLVA